MRWNRLWLLVVALCLSTASGLWSEKAMSPFRLGGPRSPMPQSFLLKGRSSHWSGESLFTYFDRGPTLGPPPPLHYPANGYEFGQSIRYIGRTTYMKWYRLEPLFPESVPFQRGSCSIDADLLPEGEGLRVESGRWFTHGRCHMGPVHPLLLEDLVHGYLLISWEDDTGVHNETIPLQNIPYGEGITPGPENLIICELPHKRRCRVEPSPLEPS